MLPQFRRPAWVQRYQALMGPLTAERRAGIPVVKAGLCSFRVPRPLVSIVIPAYNEAENLLGTLASLAQLHRRYPTELIVVDNGSTDATAELLWECGVRTVTEPRRGRSYARQSGLKAARGTYVLSADADSLYPVDWQRSLLEPLMKSEAVALTHGTYKFLPRQAGERWWLGWHEWGGDQIARRRLGEQRCINAVGFNSAFRREQALAAGGYDATQLAYDNERREDGYLARALFRQFGSIEPVTDRSACVWTNARRLLDDGSLWRATGKRIWQQLRWQPKLVINDAR